MTTSRKPNETATPASIQMRPLFVLSVWRSGSSLLYALLNQHSQVALLYEGDLPHLRLFLRGRFRNGSWRERWEFWNQGPSRHGIAIESLPARVPDVWEATRIVYQQVASQKHATIWGEKTPHWYDSPLQLARKFPDASFIFLWRDVNTVMESITRAARTERFFRKPGFATRILWGNENLRKACDALRADCCPVHEINYEDLTSNTAKCMGDICRFLEIPFESQISSLEGADRSAICSGKHHELVRGDRVVRRDKDAIALPSSTQAKINRYIQLWKKQYQGRWPKYPIEPCQSVQPAGPVERCRDYITYRALLCWDKAIKLTYAAIPVGSARSLRSWVRQRRTLSPKIAVNS